MVSPIGGWWGIYYYKPYEEKRAYINLEELRKERRKIEATKIRKSVVEKVEDVELERIYDVVVHGEKVGEIYKLSDDLMAEIKRFDVRVGPPSTKYGSATTVRSGRVSFGSDKIFHIRDGEVDDLLEIIQLWNKRRKKFSPKEKAYNRAAAKRGEVRG